MTEAPVTTGRRDSCIGPENTYRKKDGCGLVGCPNCIRNRCVHNTLRRFCRYCNDWTCKTDWCCYKGQRFCSKSALKNHAHIRRRPQKPPVKWPPLHKLLKREIPEGIPGTNLAYSEEQLAELQEEREFWLEMKARNEAHVGPKVMARR